MPQAKAAAKLHLCLDEDTVFARISFLVDLGEAAREQEDLLFIHL